MFLRRELSIPVEDHKPIYKSIGSSDEAVGTLTENYDALSILQNVCMLHITNA